jgi:hypothetical protein
MSRDKVAYDKRISDLTINEHFQVLGYGRDHYFLINRRTRSIMKKRAASFRMPVFVELAPVDWWAAHFPARKSDKPFDKLEALDFIFRAANRVGEFDEFSTGAAE